MKALYGDTSIKMEVCVNGQGHYYIGRMCGDGTPYARDSVHYWADRADAEKALEEGFEMRGNP